VFSDDQRTEIIEGLVLLCEMDQDTLCPHAIFEFQCPSELILKPQFLGIFLPGVFTRLNSFLESV
jgi:hypothetical protein